MKTTAKNEIQVTLQEYLGRRRAESVADEILVAMHGESQHMHEGMRFYVHTENGAFVLTTESVVKTRIKDILQNHLEEGDVQECLEALTEEQMVLDESVVNKTKSHPFETIKVPDSSSEMYSKLLEHESERSEVSDFLNGLETAINAKIGAFEVPVCDPSIDEDGNLQFVPGKNPAVGFSYNEIEELAKKNGLKHGDFNQWHMFLGTLASLIMKQFGCSLSEALYKICIDSTELGHFANSPDDKNGLEPTGSRMIAGKCDLGNACKILAKDQEFDGFWIAGGSYKNCGYDCPLADLSLCNYYDARKNTSIGWFVFE